MIKTISLNIDRWSLLDLADYSYFSTFEQEIKATLDSISPANIHDVFFELDDHEYVT